MSIDRRQSNRSTRRPRKQPSTRHFEHLEERMLLGTAVLSGRIAQQNDQALAPGGVALPKGR